jgi:hypothetical protein
MRRSTLASMKMNLSVKPCAIQAHSSDERMDAPDADPGTGECSDQTSGAPDAVRHHEPLGERSSSEGPGPLEIHGQPLARLKSVKDIFLTTAGATGRLP